MSDSNNTFALPRTLIIFSIVIPLALMLGYLLASPLSIKSIGFVSIVCFVLAIPLLMKWHHSLLVFSWNAAITVFFLPGQPEVWMLMAAISITFTVVNRLMNREQPMLYVPSLVLPLLFIAFVVMITMKLTGGFGIRSLGGSTYGGRRYFMIGMAILGFFALTGQRIPLHRASLFTTLFFLSAVTAIISNLAFLGGPSFYFLYYFFPAGLAYQQAFAEFSVTSSGLSRLTGTASAAPAICYVLFLRYGLQGVFQPTRIWRAVILVAMIGVGMMGGFRSTAITLAILCCVLFCFEGLFRTRWVLVAGLAAIIGTALLIPTARHLPLPIQRSISFLPLEIDARASWDAAASTEWRLRMWNVLLPQVPDYFWKGKGYGIDPTDYYLLQETVKRWGSYETEFTIAGGSYHNGPLTLIIPLGIYGLVGFLWFAIAAWRAMYLNYKYGAPELKRINTFLLAYFTMRLVYFLFLYGQFAEDFFMFTGLVGLNISLNGGVAKKPKEQFAPQPVNVPVLEEKPVPSLGTA